MYLCFFYVILQGDMLITSMTFGFYQQEEKSHSLVDLEFYNKSSYQ